MELEGQLPLELEWPEGSYERYADVFGQVVLLTVPVEWWSEEWHTGLRYKTYVGRVTSCHKGGCCVQTYTPAQGLYGDMMQCIPLMDNMEVIAQPGKLADYC